MNLFSKWAKMILVLVTEELYLISVKKGMTMIVTISNKEIVLTVETLHQVISKINN